MFPFIVMLLVPIVMQHVRVSGIGYQKKNQHALTFFFVMYTILVAFRHEGIGNDTRSYMKYYLAYEQLDWSMIGNVAIERGYVLYNKIISLISGDPRFFLVVAAVTVSAMIYPTYRRLGTDTALTIVLFGTISTFVMSFSGIRQMLAIAIGFIAYEATRKRKLLVFALAVAAAVSVHTSAFMLAFMYPLYHAKITKKWLYAIVPLLAVVFVYNEPIFAVLGEVLERYTEYDAEITSTGAYTMLILFLMFTVIAFLFPNEEKLDEEVLGMRNFLLLSVIIQMFAPLHNLAMRMNYYYIIFIPLLIPKIIEVRSRRWNQIAVLGRHVMVAFFLLYFFVNASGEGNLHVFPYHFFWENVG